MAAEIHISISAEKLFEIGGIPITNSILTSLIVTGLILAFAVAANAAISSKRKISGLQNFAEFVVESLYNLVYSVSGDHKKTRLFLPLVSSFFIFILINNWLGLLPGVGTVFVKVPEETSHQEVQEVMEESLENSDEEHSLQLIDSAHAAELEINDEAAEAMDAQATMESDSEEVSEEEHKGPALVPIFRAGTADLNTTLALALVSVVMTQVYGVQFLGLAYFKKYINFSNPIMFFVGALELVLEFAKIMSFAFRLFGNIFAGEVLLAVILFLTPIIAPMPFYGLEIFVGFVQALVFAMLTLVFFNMATIGHEEH